MDLETKRRVVELLLRCSGAPRPIEISFLRRPDLAPWRHPTPYDLHYGEDGRERLQQDLISGGWERWNDVGEQRDGDLAAHVTITWHRGMCLYGAPIREVFPEVPRADYVASILEDLEWARERLRGNPVYAVLSSCRVYWYLLEGRICSKAEAGEWAVGFVPEEYWEVVSWALAVYRGKERGEFVGEGALERFAEYVHGAAQEQVEGKR
jgi:streptomycin 3"-adenylyltransferase